MTHPMIRTQTFQDTIKTEMQNFKRDNKYELYEILKRKAYEISDTLEDFEQMKRVIIEELGI